MSHANVDHAAHRHADAHGGHGHGHSDAPAHGTRRGYLVGFALSVVLTAVPFWVVMTGALAPLHAAFLIFGFALAQIIVHVIYFLHLDTRSESGWTLLAFVFTVIIVAIVIAGSLWIMYHLDVNMMPAAPPPAQ